MAIDRKRVEATVLDCMACQAGTTIESVVLDHKPEDLGLDSLDVIEAIMAIESDLDVAINDEDLGELTSLKDMVNYICDEY